MKLKKLPEAELEIMMVLWEADEAVNSDYLMERLHKDWVKPTLLNLLSRLAARGFVSYEKEGRFNMYRPLVKKEDYRKEETEGFFERFYKSSLTSLVSALYDGKSITREDLEELKKFIDEAK